MAKRGTKPATLARKKAKGITRPSRQADGESGKVIHANFAPVEKVPSPPKWINKDGKKVWAELAPILHRVGVLTVVDLAAFADLCHLRGEVINDCRCTKRVTAATYTQLRHFYEAFGLTPGSRGRVTQANRGKDGNRFDKNKQAPTPPTGNKGQRQKA